MSDGLMEVYGTVFPYPATVLMGRMVRGRDYGVVHSQWILE
jgi:hypothetical protein